MNNLLFILLVGTISWRYQPTMNFKPRLLTVNGVRISPGEKLQSDTYILKDLGMGDFALIVMHKTLGRVEISH
jgi:hypothetical protein